MIGAKKDELKQKTDFCSGLKSTDETSMSDVERNVKGLVGAFFFLTDRVCVKSCLKVTVESVENEQPNGCGLAVYFW